MAVHLHRPALRYQVQLQLPVVNNQSRRQGRQGRAHHPRAGAGKGVSGYVAGRDSFVFDILCGIGLTVAQELLTESGSIFVQIGDENVHRVRTVMDEVFGEENFVSRNYILKKDGLPLRPSGGLAMVFRTSFCCGTPRDSRSRSSITTTILRRNPLAIGEYTGTTIRPELSDYSRKARMNTIPEMREITTKLLPEDSRPFQTLQVPWLQCMKIYTNLHVRF